MTTTVALTREVSETFARCELTHVARVPIDVDRARRQHAAYCEALRELGCHVVVLPADERSPDCVFVEDVALVVDELAVVLRPGAASRRGEAAPVGEAWARYRPVARIDAPDTVDGGDVLRLGRQVFVGRSGRTSSGGIARLDALLAPLGYDVRSVEVRGCLHLKTAVTQVAPGVLLMNRAWVDAAPWPGFDVIDVDPAEPMAANALLVGDRVLCADAFPRTIARLRAAGLAPLAIDVSEIAKAEGGLTCCSLIFAAPAGLLASGDDV